MHSCMKGNEHWLWIAIHACCFTFVRRHRGSKLDIQKIRLVFVSLPSIHFRCSREVFHFSSTAQFRLTTEESQEVKQEVTDCVIPKIPASPLLTSLPPGTLRSGLVKSAARINPRSLTRNNGANCKRARTVCRVSESRLERCCGILSTYCPRKQSLTAQTSASRQQPPG
jgi:hypothetical protein